MYKRQEAKEEYNRITEQFTNDTIDKMTFVYAGDIGTINEGNFKDVDDILTKEITSNEIYRKRLAYGDTDLNLKQQVDPKTGELVFDKDGNPVYEDISTLDIGYMSDAKFDGTGVRMSTTSVSAYVSIDTSKIPNEAVFKVTDSSTNTPVDLSLIHI